MEITPTTTDLAPVADHSEALAAGWLHSIGNTNTRNAYRRDLRALVAFLTDHDVRLLDAHRLHLDAWMRSMEADDLAPTTRARRLSSVASFYDYAIDVGVLTANPVARVKRPKTSADHVELTPALTEAEARALVIAAREAGPRDLALVLLLVVNALRVSEALSLDLTDVEMVRGHCTAVVTGKGGTVRRVTMPPVVCDTIDAIEVAEGRSTGPILTDTEGNRMNRHQAARALTRLGHAAGISRKVTPHQLRATAITEALLAGVALHHVQDLAGHSDPRTTRRYDRAAKGLEQHAATTAALSARFGAGGF